MERAFDPTSDAVQLRPTETCVCGSGRVGTACCFRSGILLPRPAMTVGPAPRVHFANPACYASRLWDCSRKMSAEHPVSESVLKTLTAGKLHVGVTGHRWQREAFQTVGIASLASKVLCTRHNELFSALDARFAAFFRAMRDTERVLVASEKAASAQYAFNGHDLERWILKALCGVVRSGAFDRSIGAGWRAPKKWLEIILGQRTIGVGQGLHVILDPRQERPTSSLYIKPIRGAELGGPTRVVGCYVSVFGVQFTLPLVDARAFTRGDPDREWIHRPVELRWQRDGKFLAIHLGWKDAEARRRGRRPIFSWRLADPAPAPHDEHL